MVGRVSLFWFDACFYARTTRLSQAVEKKTIWLDACLFLGLTRSLTPTQHYYHNLKIKTQYLLKTDALLLAILKTIRLLQSSFKRLYVPPNGLSGHEKLSL